MKSLALILGLALLAPPCHAASAIGPDGVVAAGADLGAVLKNAKPGQVLRLSPGEYPRAISDGANFPQPVTIVALDPSRPPVLRGLTLAHCSNIVLSGLEMVDEEPKAWDDQPFKIAACHDVVVKSGKVVTMRDRNGLAIVASQRVTVQGMDVRNARNGILHLGGTGHVIRSNRCEGIGSDCIHGTSSQLQILYNFATDFAPNPGAHADFIQVYNEDGQVPPSDILIEGNLHMRGNGGETENIFISFPANGPKARNITLRDNLSVDAHIQGISLSGIEGLTATGNQVLTQRPGEWVRIWINNIAGASVSRGNKANAFLYGAGNPGDRTAGLSEDRNVTSDVLPPAQAARAVAEFRAAHPEVPR